MQGADIDLFAPLMIFEEVELLAIDPLTSKLLTHLAIKAAADAEARPYTVDRRIAHYYNVFLYPYTSFRVFGTIH